MNENLEQNVEEEIEDVVEDPQVEDEENLDDEQQDVGEAWKATDDQKSGDVPVSTHIRMKQKLKGRLSDRDEEIERLRIENEQLRVGPSTPALKPPKRPLEDDFDTIQEYNEALADYEDKTLNIRLDKAARERELQAAALSAKENLTKAVDSHYTRAAKLIQDNGISTEVYQQADLTVREAIDSVKSGMGDSIADHIISVLGDGSEKVIYFLGRNKNALNEFTSLLAKDSSGLKASIFLGQQRERLLNSKRKTSRAPAPAGDVDSDDLASNKGAVFLKRRKTALKSGNLQAAYEAKKEAKLAGIDVSDW